MGVYSTTLASLIQKVSKRLGDCQLGLSESGTKTTIVDATLTQANDYWNDYDCHIYSGTNIGETKVVTDFTASTDTLSFTDSFTSSIAAASYFELHKLFTYDQYKDAINDAINTVKNEYLLDKYNATSLTLATDTYEYDVPSGFYYIHRIWVEDGSDGYYLTGIVPDGYWGITKNPDGYKIQFHKRWYPITSTENGYNVRVYGQTIQSELTADTSTCEIPPEYIIEAARAILLRQIPDRIKDAQLAMTAAENERRRFYTPPKGKPVYEI